MTAHTKMFVFAIVLLFLPQRECAYGVQDFEEEDAYPINVYKSRAMFYLDYECDATVCNTACRSLDFHEGLCSLPIMPTSCICSENRFGNLNSTAVSFEDKPVRVYQLNDWVIYPPTSDNNCSIRDYCDRTCKLQNFQSGICLKFSWPDRDNSNAPRPACACKSHKRGGLETERNTTIKAPFSPPLKKLDVVVNVNGRSVYLVSNICLTTHCRASCRTFNLANGICDQYLNKPACACDTGSNSSDLATYLNINQHAGGIYSLNGWDIFLLHDSEKQCTKALCKDVCTFWKLGSEAACFESEGIFTSCGCRDREKKTTVPTATELASVSSGSTIISIMALNFFAVLLNVKCN